jgi:acyl-CoA synthetase (AMP-forming)/AMP-acid ligase II
MGGEPAGLNLATVWETVGATVPDAPALLHGDTVRSWRAFEDRAARLAAFLDAQGLAAGSKVALYLHNRPEYLEATFAAFKIRAATANVNYRYLQPELQYLLDNCDAEAVVFDAELADRLGGVRAALPKLRAFLCVGADADHPVPEWATDYEDAVAAHQPMEPIERNAEDLWLLYTGGTTGMPKGVMWPHRSMLGAAGAATFAAIKAPVPTTLDEVVAAVSTFHERDKAVRLLPAAPLMHGTAALTSMAVLASGGRVVTLPSRSFDPHELCRAVQEHRVTQLTIVGDAFARPINDALAEADARGEPYDMSSLKVILSSGVMWSQQAKDELHRWCSATLADALGSSEGIGFANSVARPGRSTSTARFSLGEHARVVDEDGTDVVPGSGQRGLLAVGGPIPIGYYNDPEKTAATFRTIDGRVWSVPGDYATVEADGTIQLLGRGSACINTAGEKVYPEEVEEVLKLHPLVRDANVLGVPDDKWGQAVAAVVSLQSSHDGREAPDEAELIAHAKSHLAGYKCPKRVVVVDGIRRGPNGKPDYRWAAEVLRGSAAAGVVDAGRGG